MIPRALTRLPSSSSSLAETKRGAPMRTSEPSFSNAAIESVSPMRAITCRMRAITATPSTAGVLAGSP